MNFWQKYITRRLIKTKERALFLSSQDANYGTRILSQHEFAELRELIREDLWKSHFSFRGGLRTTRELEQLCENYHNAILLERTLRETRNGVYLRQKLAPKFEQYDYIALSSALDGMAISFRRPNDVIVSFPKGERGVYDCEKLLSTLTGEEMSAYSAKEVRKRVDEFYNSPTTMSMFA